MRTIMKIESLKTIEALEEFLQGNHLVAFSVLGNKTDRYNFTRKALVNFSYKTLPKKTKVSLFVTCQKWQDTHASSSRDWLKNTQKPAR